MCHELLHGQHAPNSTGNWSHRGSRLGDGTALGGAGLPSERDAAGWGWGKCAVEKRVATIVALALVAAACGSGGDTDGDPAREREVTAEGIIGNVKIRATDIAHPVTDADVEPIGDVVDITTDGTVEDGATVTIDAGEPIGDDEIVVVVTAESEDGPWESLPVTGTGTQVTASIEHLSLFSFLRFPDPTDMSRSCSTTSPPTCSPPPHRRRGTTKTEPAPTDTRSPPKALTYSCGASAATGQAEIYA